MSDQTDPTNNMALTDEPAHITLGSQLLAATMDGHHDDAWRKDCAAWRWELPDIGDAVYIRQVESEFPHEDAALRVVTDVIVPLCLLKAVVTPTQVLSGFAAVGATT